MTRARIARLGTISTLALFGLSIIVLAATLPGAALAQTSGTWSTTGTLDVPRTGHSATLLANGEVLVVGGENSSLTTLSSAPRFTIRPPGCGDTTGTFATAPTSITPPPFWQTDRCSSPAVISVPARTARSTPPRPSFPTHAAGKWSTTGSMTKARGNAGAALLPNGQVLVAGGASTDGSAATSSELYNPATGKWTATGTMPVSESAPATLLQSGLVLVAGGSSRAKSTILPLASGQQLRGSATQTPQAIAPPPWPTAPVSSTATIFRATPANPTIP